MEKIDKRLEENLDDIIYMRDNGYTLKQVASKYETSASTIGRLLRGKGIWIRSKITDNDIQDIVSSYESGKSLLAIGRKYHKSESTISSILKENGVHIKNASEARRRYTLNENYFDSIDNESKAYFLGFLYADGNIFNNSIALSLQERDKGILEIFNSELSSNRPLRFIDYKSKNENWQNQYSLNIVNKHMAESLKKWGVIPNKSLVLTFPTWIQKKLVPHFIRGYFDGDGCIVKKEKRATIIGTESFVMSVKDILSNELKINSHINFVNKDSESPVRELRISGGRQTKKFLDFIYSDSNYYLQRKHDLYQKIYYEKSPIKLAS